jgi:hypothetical protein
MGRQAFGRVSTMKFRGGVDSSRAAGVGDFGATIIALSDGEDHERHGDNTTAGRELLQCGQQGSRTEGSILTN